MRLRFIHFIYIIHLMDEQWVPLCLFCCLSLLVSISPGRNNLCESSEAGDWSCHLNQFTASTVSAFEYVIRWNLALSEKHILASYCLPVRWKHTDNMLNQWYQWIKSLLLTRMGPTIWAGFSMTKKKRCVVWNKHIIPWNIHLWHLYS